GNGRLLGSGVVVEKGPTPVGARSSHATDPVVLHFDDDVVAETPAKSARCIFDNSLHAGSTSTVSPLKLGIPVPSVSGPTSLFATGPMGMNTIFGGSDPARTGASTCHVELCSRTSPPSAIPRRAMSSGFISTTVTARRYVSVSFPLCKPLACLTVRPVTSMKFSLNVVLQFISDLTANGSGICQ